MTRYGIVLGVVLGLVTAQAALGSAGATLSVNIVGPSKVWCSDWTTESWWGSEGDYWEMYKPPTYSRFTALSSYELSGDTLEELQGQDYEVDEEWYWEYAPAKADEEFPFQRYIDIYCPGGAAPAYNTVSVTYRVTLSVAGIGKVASFEATDSMQYQVCDWFITHTIDRNHICAGAVDSDVHQTGIGVDISDGFDPVADTPVHFAPDYQNPVWSPPYYCNTPPSVVPTPNYTDCNGHADFVLTSGDGARTVPFAWWVDGERRGLRVIMAFEAPTTTFSVVDPVTEEPIEWLLNDGQMEALVRAENTQQGLPVDGHPVTWLLRFWSLEKNPDTDPPDYEGTGQAPYGTLSPTTGATDADGRVTTTYTVGTAEGWLEFETTDQAVFLH